jgi:hypothetical protein
MNEKEKIEYFVSKKFIEKLYGQIINNKDILMGNHIKNEPDIIYKNSGIEVGAIISAKNTQIEKFEKPFFEKINELVKGKLNHKLLIKLIFQEDKEYVTHTPKANFSQYPTLSKFLDGIFIHLSETNIETQIKINQIELMRSDTFPNLNNEEINKFLKELIKFVDTQAKDEFKEKSINKDNCLFSHYVVCDGKQIKNRPNPLNKFFSDKIIEKFSKDKYSNNYNKKILLLHNYTLLKGFTSDVHFYQHYRNNIFNKIDELIKQYNSLKIYDEIYFIDFTVSININDVQIINFSNYKPVILKNNPANENQIRMKFL